MKYLLTKTVSIEMTDELWDGLTDDEMDELVERYEERIDRALESVKPLRAGLRLTVYPV